MAEIDNIVAERFVRRIDLAAQPEYAFTLATQHRANDMHTCGEVSRYTGLGRHKLETMVDHNEIPGAHVDDTDPCKKHRWIPFDQAMRIKAAVDVERAKVRPRGACGCHSRAPLTQPPPTDRPVLPFAKMWPAQGDAPEMYHALGVFLESWGRAVKAAATPRVMSRRA